MTKRRYLCRWEDPRGRMCSAIFVAEGIRHTLLKWHQKKRIPDMAVYALSDDPSAAPTPVRVFYDHVFSRVQIFDLRGNMIDKAGLPIRCQVYWQAV